MNLARPKQKWAYADERDLAALGAAYGFGLTRNHPYRDGNKRIGFLAIATFLGVIPHELDVSAADVVTEMPALVSGHLSEDALADWIRKHMTKEK